MTFHVVKDRILYTSARLVTACAAFAAVATIAGCNDSPSRPVATTPSQPAPPANASTSPWQVETSKVKFTNATTWQTAAAMEVYVKTTNDLADLLSRISDKDSVRRNATKLRELIVVENLQFDVVGKMVREGEQPKKGDKFLTQKLVNEAASARGRFHRELSRVAANQETMKEIEKLLVRS